MKGLSICYVGCFLGRVRRALSMTLCVISTTCGARSGQNLASEVAVDTAKFFVTILFALTESSYSVLSVDSYTNNHDAVVNSTVVSWIRLS